MQDFGSGRCKEVDHPKGGTNVLEKNFKLKKQDKKHCELACLNAVTRGCGFMSFRKRAKGEGSRQGTTIPARCMLFKAGADCNLDSSGQDEGVDWTTAELKKSGDEAIKKYALVSNYCRNPKDNFTGKYRKTIWCYTMDPGTKTQECVPIPTRTNSPEKTCELVAPQIVSYLRNTWTEIQYELPPWSKVKKLCKSGNALKNELMRPGKETDTSHPCYSFFVDNTGVKNIGKACTRCCLRSTVGSRKSSDSVYPGVPLLLPY